MSSVPPLSASPQVVVTTPHGSTSSMTTHNLSVPIPSSTPSSSNTSPALPHTHLNGPPMQRTLTVNGNGAVTHSYPPPPPIMQPTPIAIPTNNLSMQPSPSPKANYHPNMYPMAHNTTPSPNPNIYVSGMAAAGGGNHLMMNNNNNAYASPNTPTVPMTVNNVPTSSSSSSSSSSSNAAAAASMSSLLVNRPSLVEYKHFRFLIMDAPTDSNLPSYIDVLKKKKVVALVRACEPTYSKKPIMEAGINMLELPFADGDPPPDHMLQDWFKLLHQVFDENSVKEKRTIAVHCVAGLGRAPVLVAIALIELGMKPFDAIDLIRKRRRGALNTRQLKYLENYKPKSKVKQQGGCIIS